MSGRQAVVRMSAASRATLVTRMKFCTDEAARLRACVTDLEKSLTHARERLAEYVNEAAQIEADLA